MDPILLSAAFLIFACLTVYKDHMARMERQETAATHAEEVTAQRSEIALLHVAHSENMAKLFNDHRAEIQDLLQRIQAPEIAVVEHQQANVQEAGQMPLTDAQIAEQQELAATIERIERIENEALVQ